jgi:hypothetical protein
VQQPIRLPTSTKLSNSLLKKKNDKPDRSSTDSRDDPTTSLVGRVSYLQQRYQAEGISRNVAELLISATRRSTQKEKNKKKTTCESSWKRWCNWCVSGQIDPISASLSNILSFLADCFDDGLQYRSINVLRSALSFTHPKIDGYAVGQHPYVLNLMKGILNNRPPKPRYSYTWDVHQVTEHMKQMDSNSSLSGVKAVSQKTLLCVQWTALKLICPSQNGLGHRQRKNLIFSLSPILNLIVQ